MIDSNKIWEFFCKHREYLTKEMLMVADDPSENTEIYLTNDRGNPQFVVEIGGHQETTEVADDQGSTEEVYEDLLRTYISNNDSLYDEDDEERRTELLCAMSDLVMVMCNTDPELYAITDDDIEEMLLDLEMKLYDKYGVTTRHPYAADSGGGECFVLQFPCLTYLHDNINEYEPADNEPSEIVFLSDVTATLGQWLDADFDDEISDDIIAHLSNAYTLASIEIENPGYEDDPPEEYELSEEEKAYLGDYSLFGLGEGDFCV